MPVRRSANSGLKYDTPESAFPDAEKGLFSAEQTASFFDLTYHDLRMREAKGDFIDLNGEPLVALRGKWNKKLYTLEQIREMAHSLRRLHAIGDRQLKVILTRIDVFSIPVGPIRRQRSKV